MISVRLISFNKSLLKDKEMVLMTYNRHCHAVKIVFVMLNYCLKSHYKAWFVKLLTCHLCGRAWSLSAGNELHKDWEDQIKEEQQTNTMVVVIILKFLRFSPALCYVKRLFGNETESEHTHDLKPVWSTWHSLCLWPVETMSLFIIKSWP